MATTVLVSAYYKIPNKASHEFYKTHLTRFFRFLAHTPLIFFCEENTRTEIEQYGVPLDNVEFVILPFSEVTRLTCMSYSDWQESCALDPEKYHTPELGIIWGAKKNFIQVAATRRPGTDWFIWIDAGCIRRDEWKMACASFSNRRLDVLAPGAYLQCLRPLFPPKEFYSYPDVHIAGAICVVHRYFIQKYIDVYMKQQLDYRTRNIAFISDQYINASIVASGAGSGWVHAIGIDELDGDARRACVDDWFFFLTWV